MDGWMDGYGCLRERYCYWQRGALRTELYCIQGGDIAAHGLEYEDGNLVSYVPIQGN